MKQLRLLLYPFSLLYGAVIALRNWLYDKGVLKSISFDLPVIVVGNLSTGGTGKTPHIEYLVQLLKTHFPVAVLSRGYKRRSSGFLLADDDSTALDIGDEPMQIHQKFPDVPVAVSENRLLAVPGILWEHPDVKVILMDDGFQHRSLEPELAILLTSYHHLFTRDQLLPTGNLREPKSAYQRANIIIVTKCPDNLPAHKKEKIKAEINPLPHQQVFFSGLAYQTPVSLLKTGDKLPLHKELEVLLLCGIASTETLEQYVGKRIKKVHTRYFTDHHYFTQKELESINKQFESIAATQKIILTTEKDAMRLLLHKHWLERQQLPIYILRIEVDFKEKDKQQFNDWLVRFLKQKIQQSMEEKDG